MGNIKKIIAEEEAKRREARESSFYDSPVHKVAIKYSSKAEKINSFASRVFSEFSSETDWKFEYKGTKVPYYGDCLAYYSAVRGKGIHLSRRDIIIGIKEKRGGEYHSAGGVLKVDGREYGSSESMSEITEDWFIRILANRLRGY